jgi:5-methyltetrahydrofolate corrinoid/iron sulfur protein methyltransferase
MIIIGERINGGFKDIVQAVKEKDRSIIQKWARKQTEAGADYIDVNIGAVSNKVEDFLWMIETVQNTVDTPISIDSNKVEFVKRALEICVKEPIINSTTAHEEKLEQMVPLAVQHNASLIGVCMDEKGSPQDVNRRVELGAKIFVSTTEKGLPSEKIFLDPVTMPLKFLQPQASYVLEALRQFKLLYDPPPHMVIGLSNISSQTKEAALINRIFLVMAVESGLDAAICDATDKELVNAAIAAELILNKQIYSDSFIKAYHAAKGRTS